MKTPAIDVFAEEGFIIPNYDDCVWVKIDDCPDVIELSKKGYNYIASADFGWTPTNKIRREIEQTLNKLSEMGFIFFFHGWFLHKGENINVSKEDN